MATFSRNAWVTGETITADKLNDPRYGSVNVLAVTEADLDLSTHEIVLDLTIETGLDFYDLYNLILIRPTTPGGDPNEIYTMVPATVYKYLLSDGGTDYYFWIVYNSLWDDSGVQMKTTTLYYVPATGKLTTTDPWVG